MICYVMKIICYVMIRHGQAPNKDTRISSMFVSSHICHIHKIFVGDFFVTAYVTLHTSCIYDSQLHCIYRLYLSKSKTLRIRPSHQNCHRCRHQWHHRMRHLILHKLCHHVTRQRCRHQVRRQRRHLKCHQDRL